VSTDLDFRQFRSESDSIVRTFNEHAGEVSAVYSGGDVTRGYLVGTRAGDRIDFRFVERASDGKTSSGRGTFVVEESAAGLRLHETWTLEPGGDSGAKVLEEMVVEPQPAPVTLQEVTEHNVNDVLALRVAPHQEGYVAPVARSIAQAHHNDPPGWYRAVYAGDRPVGFVMLAYEAERPGVTHPGWYLWRFLVDQDQQRHGYGRKALELVCEHIKAGPPPHELWTSWVDAPGGPERFYTSFGFVPTGEIDDDEVVARLERWPG
jgi:diamine N-acetyltransferase